MAEYLQSDDEDKEELPNRRKFLRGDFLSSWLRLQRQPKDGETDETKDEDNEKYDEKSEKKLSFSERLFRKLGKAFKNLISVEPVADTVLAYGVADITRQKKVVLGKTESEDLSSEDDGTDYVNVPLGSQDREMDEDISSAETDIEQTPVETEENFDLAQQIVAPEEAPPQRSEINPGVGIDAKAPVDHIEKSPERTGSSTTGSSAVSAGEILRQRQEKKLKKEVAKLKKNIQDLETEQKTVKLQEEVFARQIIKQQSQEKIKNSPSLKLEQLNSEPKPKVEISPQKLSPEQDKPRIETKKSPEVKEAPLFTEKFRELIAMPTETQPDVIMEAVERAAEQNAPIENIYEHRHEIKDRKDDDYIITKGAAPDMSAKQRPINVPLPQREKVLFSERSSAVRQSLKSNIKPTSNDMYKQAIRGGFWTAIILIVMIGLLIIITR